MWYKSQDLRPLYGTAPTPVNHNTHCGCVVPVTATARGSAVALRYVLALGWVWHGVRVQGGAWLQRRGPHQALYADAACVARVTMQGSVQHCLPTRAECPEAGNTWLGAEGGAKSGSGAALRS